MSVQQPPSIKQTFIVIYNDFIGVILVCVLSGAFTFILSDDLLSEPVKPFKYILSFIVVYFVFASTFSKTIFEKNKLSIYKIFPYSNLSISFDQIKEVILYVNVYPLQFGSIGIKYYSSKKERKKVVELKNSLEVYSLFILFKNHPQIKSTLKGDNVKTVIKKCEDEMRKNGIVR